MAMCIGPNAHAIGLHFWPSNISVHAKPGETVTRAFCLKLLPTSIAARFQTRVEDWWRSADNRDTYYAAPGTLKRSCGKWCSLNPVEADVKPGDTMSVKVTVSVPSDAQPGGYWSALTVEQVRDPSAPKPSGAGMMLRSSVSVGIFVEVGAATRSAKLTAVGITGDRASVTMRNEGNIPLRITPTIEFYKPGEEKPVATMKMPAEPLLPEPSDTCQFSAVLPSAKDLPSGKYKVRVIVDAGLDYLMGAEKQIEITRQ